MKPYNIANAKAKGYAVNANIELDTPDGWDQSLNAKRSQ